MSNGQKTAALVSRTLGCTWMRNGSRTVCAKITSQPGQEVFSKRAYIYENREQSGAEKTRITTAASRFHLEQAHPVRTV